MTQIVKYFCDVCLKECLINDGLGTFAGFIVKLNPELKPQRLGFEGHYCFECAEKIIEFIDQLKNGPDSRNKQPGESNGGGK